MKRYQLYTPHTAPAPANQMLAGVEKMLGFVPHVFAILGNRPPVLEAFIDLNTHFSNTSFSVTEREIIQNAVSVENKAIYCVAGHTAFSVKQDVSNDVIEAVRNNGKIEDKKLAALHDFTRLVTNRRGKIKNSDLNAFFDAGYNPDHVRELILGVCLKVFSNFTSTLFELPLDDAFVDYAWKPDQGVAIAGTQI